MSMRNGQTPGGTVVVTAGSTAVDFVGVTVISASDLTYVDGKGATTTLTAVPAGITINCRIISVPVCSGVVLGYLA